MITEMKMYVTGNIDGAYLHSIMQYELIFWGKSSHGADIYKVQKNRIRIIRGCRNREWCRGLFKDINILPLEPLYVLLLHVMSTTCTVNYMYCQLHVLSTTCTVTTCTANYMYCQLHVLSTTCTVNYMYCQLHVLSLHVLSLLLFWWRTKIDSN